MLSQKKKDYLYLLYYCRPIPIKDRIRLLANSQDKLPEFLFHGTTINIFHLLINPCISEHH